MATIVTKYSAYALHSIEFFIEKILAELVYRDIKGLTNDKIEIINVTKQHPLVSLMAAQLNTPTALDVLRSNIVPAISVTPGGAPNEEVLGAGKQAGIVDADFIADLDIYEAKSPKDRLDDALLSSDQIDLINAAYTAQDAGNVLYELQTWRKKEEINISVWSDSPDIDNLLGNLMDSLLAEIQVGFIGDNSPVVDLGYNTTKGLTNFNYGRVLFGIEYSLTFLNTFNNYTIYSENKISEHDQNFTYTTPGEE